MADQLEAVRARQHDIRHDQVDSADKQCIERLLRVQTAVRGIACRAQAGADDLIELHIVLDDKHMHHGIPPKPPKHHIP